MIEEKVDLLFLQCSVFIDDHCKTDDSGFLRMITNGFMELVLHLTGQGDACRGYALRGANCESCVYTLLDLSSHTHTHTNPLQMPMPSTINKVISKDPTDPNKTRFTMLSHANPGGGLPQWVRRTMICFSSFFNHYVFNVIDFTTMIHPPPNRR